MKEISLSQGMAALVDDEDYEWLSKYNWHAEKGRYTYYAKRNTWIDGKGGTFFMHREILGLKKNDGKIGDHKNRNGLDCRRNNLRIVDHSFNNYNCKFQKHNTSGYRGVSFHKQTKRWESYLTVKCVRKHLGRFSDITDAAIAHDHAAMKYFGNDAILNFPRKESIYV
jgi:hypothetical protein